MPQLFRRVRTDGRLQTLHAGWRVASESRANVNAVKRSTLQPEKWACLGQGSTAERRKTDIIQSAIFARASPLRRRRNHLDLQFHPASLSVSASSNSSEWTFGLRKGTERAGRVVDQVMRASHACAINRRLMRGAPRSLRTMTLNITPLWGAGRRQAICPLSTGKRTIDRPREPAQQFPGGVTRMSEPCSRKKKGK